MKRERAGPMVLMGLGVVLLAASLAWVGYGVWRANPAAEAVPASLARLPLTTELQGRQALAGLSELHGAAFGLTSGAVAVYGDGQATLWAAGTPLDVLAAGLVRRMEARIAEGRSPFTPVGTREVDGRAVWELTGLGQRHYYFQAGRRVIWLAADDALAEAALRDVVAAYEW